MKNNYFQKKLRDSFFKIDYFYSKERSEKPLNPKHSLFLILPPKKANPFFSNFLILLRLVQEEFYPSHLLRIQLFGIR